MERALARMHLKPERFETNRELIAQTPKAGLAVAEQIQIVDIAQIRAAGGLTGQPVVDVVQIQVG